MSDSNSSYDSDFSGFEVIIGCFICPGLELKPEEKESHVAMHKQQRAEIAVRQQEQQQIPNKNVQLFGMENEGDTCVTNEAKIVSSFNGSKKRKQAHQLRRSQRLLEASRKEDGLRIMEKNSGMLSENPKYVGFKGQLEDDHLCKYGCEICGKELSNKWNLQLHRRGMHNDERPFQCLACNGKFRQKVHLIKHLASIHRHPEKNHSGKVILDCYFCGKVFKNKVGLRRHLSRVHGDKV